MDDLREKAMNGLECQYKPRMTCYGCDYFITRDKLCNKNKIFREAVDLLKAQGEVIDALLKVGYPHNFQREPRWIVNYMYAITDVIKKAVNLRND